MIRIQHSVFYLESKKKNPSKLGKNVDFYSTSWEYQNFCLFWHCKAQTRILQSITLGITAQS